MFRRLRGSSPGSQLPQDHESQTICPPTSPEKSLLTPRAAGILGASLIVGLCAGGLTYMAVGDTQSRFAGAVLAGGAAFAGTVKLLNAIITS